MMNLNSHRLIVVTGRFNIPYLASVGPSTGAEGLVMNSDKGVLVVDALAMPVPRFSVRPDQNAGGEPSVGSVELFTTGSSEVGVWELGVGAMYDVEVEEVFVVLAGTGGIDLLDQSGLVERTIELRPGVICRLTAGIRTRWTVQQTLRKVYVIGGPT